MKIGIDIGGSHIGIGLIDDKGKIIQKKEQDIIERKNIKNELILNIVDNIQDILEKQQKTIQEIEKIGIAVPGEIRNQIIYHAHNLGIHEFDLIKELKTYFDVDMEMHNDAKCAAMCEKVYGSLKEYEDCAFLCMGTGIGSAIFLNHQLLRTRKSEAFELGHMIIQKDGKKCSCGSRGCFEQYCSMRTLKNEVAEILKLDPQKDAKEMVEQIKREENQLVATIVSSYIEHLAIGIANIMNIFEPQAICFGGSFVHLKEKMIPKLMVELEKKNLIFSPPITTKFVTAQYGNDAGIIGCVL